MGTTNKFKVGDVVKTEFGKGVIKEIYKDGDCLVYHYDWNDGHNGSGFEKGLYTGNHCWWFNDEYIKLVAEHATITITRDGNKVIAKYGDRVGVARCCPEDEFNFETGAKLAFERLFEAKADVKIVKQSTYKPGDKVKIIDKWVPGCFENSSGYMDEWLGKVMTIEDTFYNGDYKMKEDNGKWYWDNTCIEGKVIETSTVKEVKRAAKVGEYIKIVNPIFSGEYYKKGDILKVLTSYENTNVFKEHVFVEGIERNILTEEYVVLENYKPEPQKEPFKPHLVLKHSGKHYSYIGEETDLTAPFNEKLYVGDVVELFDTDTNRNHGNHMIVKSENLAFVMGVATKKFKNGIARGWQIRKVKSYKDLKHNEVVDGIKAILKENE